VPVDPTFADPRGMFFSGGRRAGIEYLLAIIAAWPFVCARHRAPKRADSRCVAHLGMGVVRISASPSSTCSRCRWMDRRFSTASRPSWDTHCTSTADRSRCSWNILIGILGRLLTHMDHHIACPVLTLAFSGSLNVLYGLIYLTPGDRMPPDKALHPHPGPSPAGDVVQQSSPPPAAPPAVAVGG
jgi:hypothetical protein